LSNPRPYHFTPHPHHNPYRLVHSRQLQATLSHGWNVSLVGHPPSGLFGCVIMGLHYRIVSIHKERSSTMRTLAWVIVLVVIAVNEPFHLLKIFAEFIATLMHAIGL